MADVAAQTAPIGHGRFLGSGAGYRRLIARDAVTLIGTLGLYRFWFSTDVRQYLWSHSELAGEQLDYTGHPLELLVGFLLLIVVVGPVLAVFSLLSVIPNLLPALFFAYLPLAVLAALSVLALYQARRYRVNHTVFRGLRFHQTGSSWIYAILTVFWFIINVVTLGLSYPWARSHLERYKMRHTFYGDVQGGFVGSGWALFKRGFPVWLVSMVPLIWLFGWLGEVSNGLSPQQAAKVGAQFEIWFFCWLLFVGLIVYPLFHAAVLRWRIAGIRFGTLSLKSDFSTWRLVKAYWAFFALMVLFAILAIAIVSVVQIQIVPRLPIGQSAVIEFISVLVLAVAYFAAATIVVLAYQATVRFTAWHLVVDSLEISGLDQLDRAKANPKFVERRSGRIGAALNIGGF